MRYDNISELIHAIYWLEMAGREIFNETVKEILGTGNTYNLGSHFITDFNGLVGLELTVNRFEKV